MCKTFFRLAITKYINVEITEDAAAADLLRYITPTSIWMIYAQLVQDIRGVPGEEERGSTSVVRILTEK